MSSALFWSLLLVIVLVKGLFLCLVGWLLCLYLWLVQVWDVVGNGFIVALVFFFFVLGVHFIFSFSLLCSGLKLSLFLSHSLFYHWSVRKWAD